MFNNMKIWLRFLISFSAIIVLLLTIILISMNYLEISREKLDQIVNVNNVRIQLANRMIDNSRKTAIDVRNILLAKYQKQSPEEIQQKINGLIQTRKSYQEAADALRELVQKHDTIGLAMLELVNIHADSARVFQDEVIGLVEAGKVEEATDHMFGMAYPMVSRWITETGDLVHYNEHASELFFNQSIKAESNALTFMIILGVVAVFLALGLGILLTRSITGPFQWRGATQIRQRHRSSFASEISLSSITAASATATGRGSRRSAALRKGWMWSAGFNSLRRKGRRWFRW